MKSKRRNPRSRGKAVGGSAGGGGSRRDEKRPGSSQPAAKAGGKQAGGARRGGKGGGESRQGGKEGKALADRIIDVLSAPNYEPLTAEVLGRKVARGGEAGAVIDELKSLERRGRVARIRTDRYILPAEADLFPGVIHVHTKGFGHVLSETAGQPDLFISAENVGTAMHGDRVLARITREGLPGGRPGRGGARSWEEKSEGRVIRILERATDQMVGTLQSSKQFHFVVPDDPRFQQDIYVDLAAARKAGMKPTIGDKVVVRLFEWESRHLNPEGEVIEILGRAGDPGVDVLSIIRKFRLPTEFAPDVIEQAEQVPEEVPASDSDGRDDWRGRDVVTIDPDDAKDFDDAIHVERTGHGWRLAVHIADVSHYVRPGSPLDREALARGNSVYLADRVVPMLPERLSNGVCSLNPMVDRLTQLALMEFNEAGECTHAEFRAAVIRSAARFTYKQAFAILQARPGNAIEQALHTAWELAALLRRRRFAHGSLDLDFPEIKVRLDDRGKPVAIEKIENDISHQLIEEFMLAANEAVAARLKRRSVPAVYRVHEPPDEAKLAEYREVVRSHGIEVGDLNHRDQVVALLKKLEGRPEGHVLKVGLLRSLQKARYATEPLGHYGLAKHDYCHFTSPIRRYADLVVHRTLSSVSGGARRDGLPTGRLREVAEHISTTERTAQDAERSSVKLKQLEYFKIQAGSPSPQSFRAIVLEVRNYGLFVELTEFLTVGMVHISALQDDFYVFDGMKFLLRGRKRNRVIQAGEILEVVVDKVDLFKQQVDFRPAGR